jgi:hypothetical protein
MLSTLSAASLQEYEKQTGIALPEHPLAEQLRYPDSPESVTAILREQLPTCSEFGESDRIMKSLSSVVSVLYTLSVSVDLSWVCSKMLIGLFHSDAYSIAILRGETNICWVCCPTHCMSLFILMCVSF